jgi:Ala-tRNA(Pro) deacylase
MPESPEGLLARLDALGIAHRTVSHPPVFTVEQSKAMRPDLPGGHVKNLFLKPQKPGPYLLAVVEEDRRVPVNALVRGVGMPRMAFAPPEDLMEHLGVEPGSVTPLGLVNARPGRVRPVIDRHLVEGTEWINVHPLTNAMTTCLRPGDLLRFLRHLGHAPEVVDIPEAA